jgi:acyl-CoA thioesterase-1
MGLLTAIGAGVARAEAPLKIVALGDSLTAGLGLPKDDAFPAKLQRALAKKGIAATVINAGVSGDTSSGGLARLDWSVPMDADAVIVELGANDALRGTDVEVTRRSLDDILRKLKERNLPVLLCGMYAPPNLGRDYFDSFAKTYSDLAQRYGVVFYPFFLDGVMNGNGPDHRLIQADGLHPTAAGVDVVVDHILPKVEQLVAQAKATRAPATAGAK